MAFMGASETEGRLNASTPKKNYLRHKWCQGNPLASNNANIDRGEPDNRLEDYNHQLGSIRSHHYHHHNQGDNLRMALEERGGGCGQVSARSGTHRVGALACDQIQRSSDDGLRPTSRRCVNSNGNLRHRTRANSLTRSLVASNQMILMTSLSFLFLLVVLSMQQQQHHQVAALKLPSFLASWIPQQQQVSATGQLQDLVAAADLSGDHSSNLLLFGPTTSEDNNVGPTPKLAKQPTSPLKRPFGGIVGKHPIGSGHHLFSALPKSLFGRILSGGGQQQSMQQQQQQQVGAGAILSPMTRQQQQQLVLAMMANRQKYHQLAGGQQQPPPTVGYWPLGTPLAASSGGNYSQHASLSPQGNFINANNHQFGALGQQQQQQPITSFRPTAQAQNSAASGQSEPPKKHALGYGESDEDFVIVNAEQVPDLQRPPIVMQPQQHQQEQRRPLAAAVPTRHPSEEYREMPAIVIADPDDDDDDQTVVASLGLPIAANQTMNATASGDQEQVKLQPLASQSNMTTVATSVNQTVLPDVTPAPPVDSGVSNSTVSKQPPPVAELGNNEAASLSFESQHQSNSSSGADTPETNRQESVASAVIVAASNDAAQAPQQQPEPEALESFVLGPYKGLSLGDDELAPGPGAHQSFQTQMESFIDPQQQFSLPAYHVPQQVHQQPQQQVVRQHDIQQQPRFGPAHSSGPQNLLLGSASNLLQQARQLIQLPFTHLPHNTHLHQQHMPAQQQQQHSAQFRRPQLMHRPQQQQQQQQQHWPTPMFGMPQRPQQQINFYPNFQQQQVSSSSVRSPQVHQQNNYNFGHQTNQRPQAYFFQEGQRDFPRPSIHQNQNFNLVVNHGNQMGRQQQPASAYFVDQQQQQHRLPPAMVAPMQIPVQDSHRQTAVLNANETARPAAHFAQPAMPVTSKSLKSGLYQIEPPKLESGDKITQQQQLAESSDDDSALQQQQKIDVQENASDEELGGGGGAADEDDEQQQQPIEQQQQQQESEQKGEQQHQSQQMIAIVEPADQGQANAGNLSQHSPNQILQVGASFGVAPNFTASTSANQSQQVAAGVNEGRRGLVFNESLERPHGGQQVADHDITTAYEFGQQQQAPVPEQQRQLTNYLDTQVYTLPYTMTVQNQLASFTPQQQQQPIPLQSYGPQRAASQQQQHQMPVTFIRTSAGWENQHGQQPLPVPEPPSWANNKQFFHHYRPVDQTFAPAQQTSPHQFTFAVQHQPGQFLMQQQQQQVLESAAPSGEQQQQQDAVNVVNQAASTSNSDQMASSSTTTPSSRADDSGFGSSTQDFSDSSTTSQQQGQQQDQERDRKSQQPPSLTGGGQQSKHVAAPSRSPSSFCAGRASGLYADVEQRCKAYYQCAPTGHQMFQCNNQTQFNQKTQNCDWWYNVDCGGRLGTLEDFEQASPSSPRSQLASMEQESATPTSASATPPSSTSPAQASFGAGNQQQQQQQQETQAADLRSFVEPPPSSTLAYNTPPPPTQATTTTTQMDVPNATTQPTSQQQQQQQQFDAQATTATTSTADERTLSSLQQFSERSSTAPTQSASAGSRISNEQQQRQSDDEGDKQTFVAQATTTTTASSNQLIEVVNLGGQTDDGSVTQPRVGASPNDDTPAPTSQATPTSTPQQTTTIISEAAQALTTTGRQTTEEQATQNEVTTQREQQPEVRSQISQATPTTTTTTSGKPSARRFIQSEFGGSTKTARAISHQRKFKQQQQQQVASTGDLLAVDAALPGISPLQDEMSTLHAQLEEHHSVRLGSSQTSQGDPQQRSIYSTSANQGSVSYDPQAGVREQQTIDLLGQFTRPARTGFASSRAASESAQQQQQQRPSQEQGALDETQKPTTTRTLERRFGARLPATPKRP